MFPECNLFVPAANAGMLQVSRDIRVTASEIAFVRINF